MDVISLKTKENMVLREAKTSDAAKIIEHLKKVGDESYFLSFNGEEFNKTRLEEEKIILEHQMAENQVFLIAIMGEEIVGVSNIVSSHKHKTRHAGELGISVVKAHWNKGIGYHMINYMINWAKETGIIRKLDLEVQADNLPAIKLYQKLGFEKEGIKKRGTLIDGKFYDLVLMGLFID